jgi:hypothetical protein
MDSRAPPPPASPVEVLGWGSASVWTVVPRSTPSPLPLRPRPRAPPRRRPRPASPAASDRTTWPAGAAASAVVGRGPRATSAGVETWQDRTA